MKKTNKTLSIILAILMIISIIPITASAATPTSGKCGDNIIWEYDESTSTLTFTGEGAMYNYDCYFNASNDEADDRPWCSYTSKIKNIIINEGITTISEKAFYNFRYLCFVTIPSSLIRIEDNAFSSREEIMAVNYLGSEEEFNNIEIGDGNADLYNSEKFYFKDDYVPVSDSGTCGDNLAWIYDANTFTLTFSGTGDMIDFYGNEPAALLEPVLFNGNRPWEDYEFAVKKVIISDGITSIGKNAFAMFINLESIEIPDSVTNIGYYSFGYCINLTDVYYSGSEDEWSEISIGSYNELLLNATIHYDYLECEHNYIKDVISPTCTQQGYTKYKCSICGYSYTTEYVDALGHNYDEGVIIAPTCTNQGYTRVTCSNCGDSYTTEYVDALGHNYDEGVIIAPTCTGKGSTKYTCLTCGYFYQTDYVDATGHKYESVVTEPTCTEGGYTTNTCTVCGNKTIGNRTEKTGHNVDTWETVSQPNCTAYGIEKGFCSNCNQYVQQTIAKLGHDYGELMLEYDATCTTDGRKSKQCSRCGNKKSIEIIPATGHAYGEWVQIDNVKCGEYGKYERVCSTCGQINVMSAPGAHNYSIEYNVVEATCTTAGSRTVECSDCGKVTDEIIPAKGHSYTSEITTPATHITEGVETFTCDCGDTYTEVIEKLAEHNYESNVTAPTCTEQGHTTYYCECGDVYVSDYVDALGHNYSSEITTPATHITEGVETFTCDCGDTYTEVIEKLAEHNYESVVTAPTCTEQGYTTFTCECGDSYIDDYGDALGHTPADATEENYVASTCTETGSREMVVYCSVCNAEISREKEIIEKVEHTVVEYEKVIVAPTCTGDGTKEIVSCCTDCDSVISKETVTIDANGHKDNDCDGYCDVDDELLDPTVECDCNCHKSGIKKLFFNIILLFQKIFGGNKVCECGAAHY